jgi:hypothetical protein
VVAAVAVSLLAVAAVGLATRRAFAGDAA